MFKQTDFYLDFPAIEFVPGTALYLTRQGDTCMTVKVHGVEPGCKNVSDLEGIQAAFKAAITTFDPRYRIQQTLFNTAITEIDWLSGHGDPVHNASIRLRRETLSDRNLYRKDLFYTFVLQGTMWESLALAYGINSIIEKLLKRERARMLELINKVHSFISLASSSGVSFEVLDRDGVKRFLNRFVSFREHNQDRAIAQDKALDFFIPNAKPHLYPDYIWHDGNYLAAVSLRELPRIPDIHSNPDPNKQVQGSYAGIFKEMLAIDCPFIASLEIRLIPDWQMSKIIVGLHKAHDNKVTSFISRQTAGKNETRSDLRQDPVAIRNRDIVGQANVSLSQEPWVEYNFSMIFHAPTRQQVESAVPAAFRALRGATCTQEDMGIYDIWTNAIPGNWRRHPMTIRTSISAATDTFLLWGDDEGVRNNPMLPTGKALMLLETQHRGLHYFQPFDGQVMGMMMFGEMGSGKTFLANHVADNISAQWTKLNGEWIHPKMLILDMKDSYEENTRQHGGTYLRMTLSDPGLRSNPWSLPESTESVETIVRLMKLMLSGDDGYVTKPEEDARIAREVKSKYVQKRQSGLEYARLRFVNLGHPLQQRLEPWIGRGQYARFFDNEIDDLANNPVDWLTIQLTGFSNNSYVIRPLLYWHWERFMAMVHDPALTLVPKFVLLDEAHVQMMMSPEICVRMLNSINTGRAFNLWPMFVMQWAHLLYDHPFGPALIAAMPIKLFGASQNISAQKYADIFEMPLSTAETIKTLIPRREFIYYTAKKTQKLSLIVDLKTAAVYANDVQSNAARHARRAIAATA